MINEEGTCGAPIVQNMLTIPNDEKLKSSYKVYKPSLSLYKLDSEKGRNIFAEALRENYELCSLVEMCVRKLAKEFGPRTLPPSIRDDKILSGIFYDSLDINTPLERCYKVCDVNFWKRVVLSKKSNVPLTLSDNVDWKKLGISQKYVDLVEACPAEYWPAEEMNTLALKVKDFVTEMHIKHLQSLRERYFDKYYVEQEINTSSSEELTELETMDLGDTTSSEDTTYEYQSTLEPEPEIKEEPKIEEDDNNMTIENMKRRSVAIKKRIREKKARLLSELHKKNRKSRLTQDSLTFSIMKSRPDMISDEVQSIFSTYIGSISSHRDSNASVFLSESQMNIYNIEKEIFEAQKAKRKALREKQRQLFAKRMLRREKREIKLQERLEREALEAEEALNTTKKKKKKIIKKKKKQNYNLNEMSVSSNDDLNLCDFENVIDQRNPVQLLERRRLYNYPEEHCHHIDLSFVGFFDKLQELTIEFLGPNMKRNYHSRHLNFSLQDIKNLAK